MFFKYLLLGAVVYFLFKMKNNKVIQPPQAEEPEEYTEYEEIE